ncbi:MAG: 6,7-dimethyl-8-ribityllumazine synthase [Candidatus Gracilibacteria bacterium]
MKINHSKIGKIDGRKLKIAIILPYFNDKFGLELLKNTENELLKNKVKKENIRLVRVAGSLEIPFACQKGIKKYKPDAVIALGIIIRGETKHFDLVAETTHFGLMKIQLENKTPISFGIIACENTKQVIDRVSKAKLNKGKDFATAALLQTTI